MVKKRIIWPWIVLGGLGALSFFGCGKNEKISYNFSFPNEVSIIERHASRYNVEPELIMAIREAEKGANGREYGIIPQGEKMSKRYRNDNGYSIEGRFVGYEEPIEKQVAWCASTINKRLREYRSNPSLRDEYPDAIAYLASKYAPKGAGNDPNNLNENWECNVRNHLKKLRESKSSSENP